MSLTEEEIENEDYLRDRPSRKRRRLNHYEPGDDSLNESDKSSPEKLYKAPKVETESDTPRDKPKPKHRIHIPKNPQIPKDAFYTQPPQRSSPYRINEFRWRKPPDLPTSRSKSSPKSTGILKRSIQVLRSDDEGHTFLSSPADLHNGGGKNSCGNAPLPQLDSDRPLSAAPQSELTDGLIQNYEDVLADLPSDAFSSPAASSESAPASPELDLFHQQDTQNWRPFIPHQGTTASRANLRQTTLFRTQAQEASSQSPSMRKTNWPLASREEPPTHHKLDRDALKTWVFPTNLGAIREYQYNIVARGLYHNMLVALPTGLGKTFIAATIMLNWFRWTTNAQIVFVAPTKPLVSQQVQACFGIVGIPPSATTMLTGGIAPGIRAEEWSSKRVFFMTPQTIINDLKTGICDPKRIVLLVVDEAHRATGSYAYVEVVKFLARFNSSFRVLALTATPGASIEGVQEVIDGLGISRIEIRTEESLDIRQYVHSRKVDTVLFDNSEEMVMIMDLFSKSLQPVLDKVNRMNAYWLKDPIGLTPYGCTQARIKWMASNAGKNANWGIKAMVNTIFSLLASLAHGIELLKFHGIGPFYRGVVNFRDGDGEKSEKGGKYRKDIVESIHFQTMITKLRAWVDKPDFVGHPKLEYVQSVVLRHFVKAGDGSNTSTRIMIFSHYRDSAEEIARVLKRNEPMIRPHVFVGQSNSKGSDGMDQKTQLAVIKKFQEGTYNTLVATSIGEEGLDIGEVDLIICYDASASPIRMLQRMGRTGRKRAGNIVVTLMRGKEEINFTKAKDNYEKMQKEIAAGTRFNYHEERCRRIVPKDIQPFVDKRVIEIPLENSQADLPEPKKRGRPPKRPAKIFHMPNNVQAGFVRASRVQGDKASDKESLTGRLALGRASETPEPIPSPDDVLLTTAEQDEFVRRYLNVGGDEPQVVDVPRLEAFPNLQRSLRPTKYLKHGRATIRFVKTLGSIHNVSTKADNWYEIRLESKERDEVLSQVTRRIAFFRALKNARDEKRPCGSASFNAKPCMETDRSRTDGTPPIDQNSLDMGDVDDDFNEFIDDGMNEVSAASSSAFSSHAMAGTSIPFYEPGGKSYNVDTDSGEDLPDFKTLVQRNEFTPKSGLAGGARGEAHPRPSRRRGKRLVIEADSDDDE